MTWATATDWKTRECMKFAGKSVYRLPKVMRSEVIKDYLGNYKNDYKSANLSLVKLNSIIDRNSLDNQPLRDHFDEDRLKEIASEKVDIVKMLTAHCYVYADKFETVKNYIENIGITICEKLLKRPQALVVRALDIDWWRRQLRKVTGRSAEELALNYGLVHKGASIYCSDFAVARYRAMKKRNRAMMESTILSNENGDEFTLQELSDKTTANPVIRRGELMTRLRGFEEYAKYTGQAAVFFTVTAPSRYHIRSSKYSGETPRDTQCYLNGVWARIRAQLAREEIDIFGFRIAEPHHDGTPHQHSLLFVAPEKQSRLVQIFNQYALAESPKEKGAFKHRLTVEFIDRRKGSAAAYIAKYISKNIDGFGVDNDLYGFDAASSAERITAWASLWGIRQFQQIGGIPVTIWRTLRRIETPFEDEQAEAARKYADSGEWGLFTRHCAAASLSLYKVLPDTTNRYGEESEPVVLGVICGLTGEIGLKVLHDWEPRQRPWTRVNNCTQKLNYLEETNNRLEKAGFGLPPPTKKEFFNEYLH